MGVLIQNGMEENALSTPPLQGFSGEIEDPIFCAGTVIQLEKAHKRGVTKVQFRAPVADSRTNQITIGANGAELTKSPFTATLSGHPSGIFIVGISSDYGLSCPSPVSGFGRTVIDLRREATEGVYFAYECLTISASNRSVGVVGYGFGGEFSGGVGLDIDQQKIFVAQIAGVFSRRRLQ